jgi:hypothetical protein
MKMVPAVSAAALLLATLAACSTGAPSPGSTGAAATSSAGGGGGGGGTATTTIDPCQLVTAPEASALTGASYGPGTRRTFSGLGNTCVYGGGTKNVFMVDAWQGSASQLQKLRDLVIAGVQKGSAPPSPIPVAGLGDSATAYQISNAVFNGASIFVLKGTNAIYLVDEVTGGSAPTTAALTATARTAVGRLP